MQPGRCHVPALPPGICRAGDGVVAVDLQLAGRKQAPGAVGTPGASGVAATEGHDSLRVCDLPTRGARTLLRRIWDAGSRAVVSCESPAAAPALRAMARGGVGRA